MQKKKINVKQTIFLILLLAIFLIVATYAWFTSNTLVKIETIDISVATSAGFQISVDATNWKSVLTVDDITTGGAWGGNINHIPSGTNMQPVSTVGNTNVGGLMEMYKGKVDVDSNTGSLMLTATAESDVKSVTSPFIAFDVFFKVNQTKTLYLNNDSNVVGRPNVIGQTRGLENATRIGFIEQGYMDYEAYEEDALNTGLNVTRGLNEANRVVIWEPNSDSHTLQSIADAANSYGLILANALEPYDKVNPYSGVKATIADPGVLLKNATASANGTLFGLVETPASPDPAFNFIQTDKPLAAGPTYQQGEEDYYKNFGDGTLAVAESLGIELNPGVTKVRIYMWIEGQDYDCQDFASGTGGLDNKSLSFNLSFTIDP